MKRMLSLFLGVLMVLSMALAGCSSSGNDTEDNGEGNGEVLTIGSWRTEDKAAYDKIIEAFNEEHPDIKVEFKPSKNTEYDTILNTALQSGEGPDIIQLRPYAPGMELAKAGYLEPLDDLDGIDVFTEETRSAATSEDGKVYGVPLSLNSAQMFYNKKMFKDHGLEEPETWDEFIELNEKLKEEGVTPIALGTKEGWLLSLAHSIFGPAHYGANEFVDQITSGDKTFKDAEFVSSLQAMDELKQYFPKNYEGLGMEDIRTLFFTGEAAMFPLGSWEIEVLREMNPDLEIGFFPMPSAEGKDPTMTTWVDGSYGINANSKNKEDAKKFLEFMTTEKFAKLFSDELARIPAVPGVTTDDELVTAIAEATNEYSTSYMMLVHFNKGNPTTKATLETELQGMYLGKQTPEEVAEKLQGNAETYFEPFQ
ncbi:ABC transporter substrate-binding protein [Pseudalkalibacillus salsuginis]|uniref:ABC transporter substrate-binding protein n=1 Tax=Pseudalkalibacillus salsuginis TaxID=2910972 RepID=UPI001F2E6089|nr:extracellular solute-binding protein [Pseudalkalibacillus salsuginis]MCF6410324.1 extracellular solute-binding protein [Pseudalkalibacillus salsuginis]